jgi:outer membrane protein
MLKMAVVVSAALLGCGWSAASAQQADGPWLVRVRAVHLNFHNASAPGRGALAGLPADAIKVNSKWIPEFDISYFFNQSIALELILTVPQKQTVTVDAAGLGVVGTFRHLPPSLLLQYHCTGCFGAARPYVGAGVNYTRIFDQDFRVAGLAVEDSSVGATLQIGLDVPLEGGWSFNADIKKVWMAADVKLNGQTVSRARLDPWLFGVGIGYRF